MTSIFRRFTERASTPTEGEEGPPARQAWRSRATLAGVVAICMVATTLAVTGAGADTAGMKFLQSGHLIYNSTLKTVFHIDGGTKNIDGQVKAPELGSGVRTVQTDTHGYMLARGSITEFGKSDLSVADPRPAPSEEQPAALEAAGVAFAVYREAGAISRLGSDPVTVRDTGGLGAPVVTSNGTLWVHRITNGELCQLPTDADRLSCPAELASGHGGALTVVKDQVVFVDTTARELRAVSADGFGRTVPVPGGLITPQSMVAPYDVNGRIAIVDQAKNEIQLVDAAALVGDREPAEPVARKLPPGKYTQIASSGAGVALIDESKNKLVTLDENGVKKSEKDIPPRTDKAKPRKGERPELFRGADSRLYVDSVSGEHSLVVDDDGEVTEVEARERGDDGKKNPEAKPTTPPTTPPSTPPSTTPPTKPTRTEPTRTNQPPKTNGPDEGEGENENKPNRPRRTEPPETTEPPKTNKPRQTTTPSAKPKPKPVKASPAAAPPGFAAKAGDSTVTLTWRQPNLNGGKFVHYVVTRGGTSVTTTGTSYTWTGLANETAYTFRVRAVTRGTDGKTLNGSQSTKTATPRGLGKVWIENDGPVSQYGDEYTDSNCPEGTREEDCAYIRIHASGLKPNTTYTFRAYASSWGELHAKGDGYDGYELTTDSTGKINEKKFHNAAVGQRVWVTAEGPGGPYKSAAITWPSG